MKDIDYGDCKQKGKEKLSSLNIYKYLCFKYLVT